MSRVTEFSEDDDKSSRTETSRGDDGGEGGERTGLKLPKLSLGGRISQFYHDIKLEMLKTTWPSRNEVWSTTVVVLIAVIFFGFYLWGIDLLITMGFESLQNAIR
jgi:preprotein translocase subunit SecE